MCVMKKKEEKKKRGQKEPMWKKAGFKSQRDYDEWYNEALDDIRHGYM